MFNSKDLSQEQSDILDYIREYWERNDCSPVIREISKGTGQARSTAHRHLNDLEASGHIRRPKPSVYRVVK